MLATERLKECRKKSGMNQEEIAKHLHINVRTYKYYEAGGRQPSIEALVALADFFCVSADYLLGRSENPDYIKYVTREEDKIFRDVPADTYHFYSKNILGKELPQYRAVMETSKGVSLSEKRHGSRLSSEGNWNYDVDKEGKK